MAYCNKCGTELGADAAFCPKCGQAQMGGEHVTTSQSAQPGLAQNVAGLLCYALGWVTGLIFFLIDKRPSVQSGLYLLTYDIAQKKMVNHGPILSRDQRRVFFSESIAIGKDDHIYTVAWVEVTDTARREAIAKARAFGPAETAQMVYEMLLVKLPTWQDVLSPINPAK